MSVQYNGPLKDARMEAVIDAIDAGTNPGVLEICSAAYGIVLVSLPLSRPSFVSQGGGAGVITLANVPVSTVAVNTGTAAAARIKDSNNNIVVDGLTVGVSGADINLVSTAISDGQIQTLNSGSISHA